MKDKPSKGNEKNCMLIHCFNLWDDLAGFSIIRGTFLGSP